MSTTRLSGISEEEVYQALAEEADAEKAKIEAFDFLCECGHPYSQHKNGTGGCQAIMDCGHQCICPGVDLGEADVRDWRDYFYRLRKVHALSHLVADKLPPEKWELFWMVVGREDTSFCLGEEEDQEVVEAVAKWQRKVRILYLVDGYEGESDSDLDIFDNAWSGDEDDDFWDDDPLDVLW